MSCGCGPQSCKDFDDDREGVDGADLARFGEDGVACPNCGTDLYHDVALCHSCGYAVTDEATFKPMPKWVPIMGVAAAVGIVLGYVAWML